MTLDERPAPRLRELDLLRFLAAVVVMLYAYTRRDRPLWGLGSGEVFPELEAVAHFGGIAADLFFVLSGFVILMTVWDRRPGDFARSRLVRLLPAYWFAVTLAVVVYLATGQADPAGPNEMYDGTLWRFLPNLTMLQEGAGFSGMEAGYWTLWVELHFYALIALLSWWGISYARCVWFMSAWLLAGVYAQEGKSEIFQVLLMPDWAPCFIAGMALFLVYRFGGNIVLWLLVGFCWALASYHRLREFRPDPVLNDWTLYHWAAPLAVTLIFVVMALVATGRLGFLRGRWPTALAALTYPMYLMHETIGRVVIVELRPHLNRWAVLALAVTATVAASYAVHRFVERPLAPLMRTRIQQALARIRSGEDGRPAGDGPAARTGPADAVAPRPVHAPAEG
ncbi:Peptidoglycan/LPS O-acetylase OafA/YrhL, contains acyltransferase and SGNH-hydrolase domains [Thermomonospora echinospora]|uniref:Peptidoglycan/LPS O-acetylase OafA/YrhL, contains acyltransferase and SGNH-hydrolase domains n=1 Tax=Thermomonospora echinospora TaxID=1992 RepID=A0A1H6DLD0_9ACTN|nr:acyltransferase [Thermomonospora echinospora]SEG86028.1 Peptidoglycan/LPS O-acetylase OafA/YrhL, contains acyltransferase and SGNH-hydrolase domains [Thermomonospora echinospora]